MSTVVVKPIVEDSVGRRAGRGALWTLGASISQNIVRVGSSAILARILGPEAFGLFGVAYLCYDLAARLTLSGMASGVVTKLSINERDLSTCFWALIGFGLLIVTGMWVSAPLVSIWIGHRQAGDVVRLVMWVILANSLGGVHGALLRKRLRFKTLAAIRTLAIIVESSVAVYLALNNADYWSLAYGMLAGSVVENGSLIISARWTPQISFEKKRLYYFLRFGLHGSSASILGYFASNIDYWIAAKLLGLRAFGYYEFAYRLPHIIIERFGGPAGSVVFPAMAAIREDKKKVLDWYLRSTRILALFAFPCFGGLFVVSQPLVQVLWGDKWLPVVTLMKILCIGAAMNSFWFLHRSVYLSQDRPDLPVKMGIISLSFTATAIIIAGVVFGITGIAAAMTLSRFIEIIWVRQALKLVGGDLQSWFDSLKGSAVATLVMVGLLLPANFISSKLLSTPFTQLGFLVPAGVVIYALSIKYLFNNDYLEITNVMRLVLKSA